MSTLTQAILIICLIIAIFGIIAVFYMIIALRRISIATKKFDYLIEDLTYKSELLNSTSETISKLTNYIDAFEVIARRNIKSGVRLVSKNRDVIYKMTDKIKDIIKSESDGSK